jgi:hypothetical protein
MSESSLHEQIAQIIVCGRLQHSYTEDIQENKVLRNLRTIERESVRVRCRRAKGSDGPWSDMTLEINYVTADDGPPVQIERWYLALNGGPKIQRRQLMLLFRSLYLHLRLLPIYLLQSTTLSEIRLDYSLYRGKPRESLQGSADSIELFRSEQTEGSLRLAVEYLRSLDELVGRSVSQPMPVVAASAQLPAPTPPIPISAPGNGRHATVSGRMEKAQFLSGSPDTSNVVRQRSQSAAGVTNARFQKDVRMPQSESVPFSNGMPTSGTSALPCQPQQVVVSPCGTPSTSGMSVPFCRTTRSGSYPVGDVTAHPGGRMALFPPPPMQNMHSAPNELEYQPSTSVPFSTGYQKNFDGSQEELPFGSPPVSSPSMVRKMSSSQSLSGSRQQKRMPRVFNASPDHVDTILSESLKSTGGDMMNGSLTSTGRAFDHLPFHMTSAMPIIQTDDCFRTQDDPDADLPFAMDPVADDVLDLDLFRQHMSEPVPFASRRDISESLAMIEQDVQTLRSEGELFGPSM